MKEKKKSDEFFRIFTSVGLSSGPESHLTSLNHHVLSISDEIFLKVNDMGHPTQFFFFPRKKRKKNTREKKIEWRCVFVVSWETSGTMGERIHTWNPKLIFSDAPRSA